MPRSTHRPGPNHAQAPDAAKSLFIQASTACNQGEWALAEQLLQQHLQLRPGSVAGLSLLGMVWGQLGQNASARDLWRKLLDARPDYAEGWCHLGYACEPLGDWAGASQAFQTALRLAPQLHAAQVGLGLVLQKQGRYRESLAVLDAVLQAHSEQPDALFHSAVAWQALGAVERAVALYERVLAVDPTHAQAASNRLMGQHYSSRWTLPERAHAACDWGHRLQERVPSVRSTAPVGDAPGRILQVGLVSGDLRRHPVAYFLRDVLAALDPAQVQVTAYANHAQPDDDWTQQLRACTQRWHAVAHWSDAQLVRQIQHDRIDILVDLSGHTAAQRLAVFAAQPAPIQCSWLGYFATTGLSRMDYLLADSQCVPVDEEFAFAEAVWRLPDTRLCWSPPSDAPDVSPRDGSGPLVLGCFQELAKMQDPVLHAWADILHQLAHAELRICSARLDFAEVREAFLQRLQQAGLPLQRVHLQGALARSDYWKALGAVDLLLDTFPYPGGTTTLEGLWMGVPTLTLTAPGMLARQGASLLHQVDLDACVAHSPAAYVQLAVAWGQRRTELAALRTQLRPRLLASPLCDAPRFAQHLQQAWRAMWGHACRGLTAREPAVQVRRLTPDDAPAYRALMLQAYADHPDAFTSSVAERDALPLHWWTARLAAEPQAHEWVWGAFCQGALVGAAGLTAQTREKARHKATLFGMVVSAAHRGRGLGQQLVQAVLDHAAQQPGLRLVQLTVTQGNTAAQSLYERMGFQAFGVEPMAVAVAGGYVSKVHLWRPLNP